MKKIYVLIVVLTGWVFNSFGQITMSSTGTYSQDFNSLGSSGGPFTWTDNSTIANWYSQRTGSGTTYVVDNGANNGGGLYSYGTTASTERALGTVGSSNAAAGSFAHGVQLQNTSGNVITDIKVSYTLEEWRCAGAVTANVITFWYKTSSSPISALNPNSNGTWTAVTALNLSSPVNTTPTGALDGNAVANKVSASSISIPGLSLANGDYIMLKWDDPDHSGTDHGLAIDDVTIAWTTNSTPVGAATLAAGPATEPATISSLTTTSGAASVNFDFTVNEDASADDANPTLITQIAVGQGSNNSSSLSNWTQAIAGAELSDGTNTATGTIGASSITFGSLSTSSGAIGYIADGASKTYTLKIWLNSSLGGSLPTTADGKQFDFLVQTSGFTTAATGSSVIAASQSVSSGSGSNAIDVVATQLSYVQNTTSPTGINSVMTPAVTVSAVDANGNRDLDFTNAIDITSSGTLTGSPVSVAAVAGLSTFSSLTHTVAGTGIILTASSGAFTPIVSNAFSVTLSSNATDFFRSAASGNWGTLATWESSADGSTNWTPATLIPDANSAEIRIRNGHTVTVAATAGGDQMYVDAGGTLVLNASFTLADGAGTDLQVLGTLVNTSGTFTETGTMSVSAGGLYQHNRNGSVVPTATWDAASTIEFTGIAGTTPSGLTGQTFGNVTWNAASQSASVNLQGGITNIAGNLRIQNCSGTSGRVLRFFATQVNAAVTIGGDLIITDPNGRLEFSNGNSTNSVLNIGGNFTMTNGSFSPNVSGNLTINLKGTGKTFNQSGGVLTNSAINWNFPAPNASVTLLSDLPVAAGRSITIDSALNASAFQITGGGDVIVNGTLHTSNANGISATGTFANTGTITLGAASIIDYNGTLPQAFTSRADYANVAINGFSAKTLDGPVSISGILDLSSQAGNVITSTGTLLTIKATGSVNGPGAGSFVDGPMVRETAGTGSYLFPVGKGSLYNPAIVTPATADPADFQAEFFATGTNTNAPTCDPARMEAYALNQYWDIARTSGTTAASVGLNYRAADVSSNWTNGTTAVADPDVTKLLTIAHFNGTCWQDENSAAGDLPGNAGSGVVTSRSLSTFSPFTIGYGPLVALPVNFGTVRAYGQASAIKVEWSNLTETDVINYTIERAANGRDFTALGTVGATANNGGRASYNFTDAAPLTGPNFYRIIATEANGNRKYSPIVKVDTKGTTTISLYPNPVTGHSFTLQAGSLPRGDYNLRVVNATGVQVYQQGLSHNGGLITTTVELPASIAPGMYMLLLENGDQKTIQKFLVQ